MFESTILALLLTVLPAPNHETVDLPILASVIAEASDGNRDMAISLIVQARQESRGSKRIQAGECLPKECDVGPGGGAPCSGYLAVARRFRRPALGELPRINPGRDASGRDARGETPGRLQDTRGTLLRAVGQGLPRPGIRSSARGSASPVVGALVDGPGEVGGSVVSELIDALMRLSQFVAGAFAAAGVVVAFVEVWV